MINSSAYGDSLASTTDAFILILAAVLVIGIIMFLLTKFRRR